MALKTAACIRDGVVVNAAVYDEDTSGPWLDGIRADFDDVRIVDAAGIGWTVEADGLRPPSPFPSWSWDGGEWVAPVAAPDEPTTWDEDAQAWVPVV